MSNSGYDPYADYMGGGYDAHGRRTDSGRKYADEDSDTNFVTAGGTAQAHVERLRRIHDEEVLAAMQGYGQAGAVGAASGAAQRGQAAQDAAYQAADGGLAARLAMMGAGVRGASEAGAAATGQMSAERLAAAQAVMDAQARGAEYELAAMQSKLAQKGIQTSADARLAAAQTAARQREAEQRQAAGQAIGAAAGGVVANTGSWLSDDDEREGY